MSTPTVQPAFAPPAPIRPLRVAGIFVVVGLLGALIAVESMAYLYAIVCGLALCVIVPCWTQWQRGRLDYFEPIHLFGIIYFMFFGLGSLWTVHDPGFVAYDLYIVPYVPKAALVCLLGYLALLFGYYWFWRSRSTVPRATEWPRGHLFVVLAGGIGLLGYLASSVVERSVQLGTAIDLVATTLAQLSPLYLFAWALACLLYFDPDATPRTRWLMPALFVPATLMIGYTSYGDKSLAITMVGIPIVARWYAKKTIPWTFLMVLALVIVFVVFPFYNTYRWAAGDQAAGQAEKIGAAYRTISNWDSDTYLRWSLSSFKRRLAMINSVAVVVRDVGRWVPYARGETIFMPALVFFVPRLIWPDKPVTSQGREFGRTFRITNMMTRNTYISVTIPGELYWNFDLPGVLAGMMLLGVGFRWVYRRYGETPHVDPVRQAILIAMLVLIVHLGGSLAPSMVGITRTLIVLEALRWLGKQLDLIETRPAGAVASA